MSGKIYVVGIGPGTDRVLTPAAREAIRESGTIAGYTVYVGLVGKLAEGKRIIRTGMRQEEERCRKTLAAALNGETVALVCSGDAGIYGMAGLMCEVAAEHPEIEITMVPGVTAALSGAALLGAPLGNDFAVISLSDLLTPWESIEKRLESASAAGFAICLYNPRSRNRAHHMDRAVDIVERHRSPGTCCGYVRNIGRPGETARLCSLEELRGCEDIDMFTTVFIGTEDTRLINGRLVTPRGYGRPDDKEGL